MAADSESLARETQALRRVARGILFERASAEDAVQEAWLAALRQKGQLPGEGWLREAVRRISRGFRRREARSTARDRDAARAEELPSVLETSARLEVLRELVTALESLPEPYRTAVRLRFVDDLPPREIAERLNLPVETVRTQVKRGIERMRAHLDARHPGGRDALLAALVPLAGWRLASVPRGGAPSVPASSVPSSLLPEVLAMTVKTKIALFAGALAALLMLAFWASRKPQVDSPTLAATSPEVLPVAQAIDPVPAQPSTERVPEQAASAPASNASSVASTPTTGSVLVRTVWADDQTPAAEIEVELKHRSGGDPLFDVLSGTTDAKGELRFADLAPGRYHSLVQRGDTNYGPPLTVAAGQEALSVLELKMGMNLRGEVVDERGSPIADAEVLAAGWAGDEVRTLARTDAQGRFRLRAMATHCHVGARAVGFAPSVLRQFTASQGAEVELRIVLSEPGTELRGIVLDPSGEPVAGAVVQVGSDSQRHRMDTLPDGTVVKQALPQRQRSDERGEFFFQGLKEGLNVVAVRARGLAPWREDVELLRPVARPLTVQLAPGVTLVGTVRDGAGKGLDKVSISVGEWDQLGYRSIASDANGEFRIEGLPVGELALRASSDVFGKLEAKLSAVAGQTLLWEPVLIPGIELHGRVLDFDGNPVASAMVEGRQEVPKPGAPHWWAFENTDEQGRFTFRDCAPGEALEIAVRRKGMFPEATLDQHVPSSQELVIRLPKEAWVHIRGKVLGPDEKPMENVHVMPIRKGANGSPAETTEAGTGAINLGPYPPGEYSVHLQADGFPKIVIPTRKLGPDEVWDLGTLRFQAGGSLVVSAIAEARVSQESGHARHVLAPVMRCTILDSGGEYRDGLILENGAGRSVPLSPGNYWLQVAGADVASECYPFEIRSDVETRLEVRLQPGISAQIEFAAPPGVDLPDRLKLVIRDASGKLVLQTNMWTRSPPPTLTASFLPGTYRIHAESEGASGEGSLEVTTPGPARAVIALTAR